MGKLEKAKKLAQQNKTNNRFKENLDLFKSEGQRLGVMGIFNLEDSIVPFRVVLPYSTIQKFPNDVENELKSNIGMCFYGFNFFDEIKHLKDISHQQYTEILSYALGALAKHSYSKENQIFGDDDFGVIMDFNFKKLDNGDYEISSGFNTVCVEFDKWLKLTDEFKLDLSTTMNNKRKIVENQVFIS